MLASAIVFTSLAIGIVALSAWWLYLSLLNSADRARRMSPTLAIAVAGALGVSAALMVGGALWDASMHLLTGLVPGGRDFFWPPHLMIYSGFLLAFAVGAAGILLLLSSRREAGRRDHRCWVRAYPMIGAVVLASGYTLVAIPGDALWHELVGPDLTAWSPPRLEIAAAMTAVVLCGVGLLLQARQERRPSAWFAFGLYALLGLTLNILYTVGVLEWELPGGLARMISERPGWAYPVVAGCVGFFVFSLGLPQAEAILLGLVGKADYLLVDLPSVPTPSVQAAIPRSQAVVLLVEPTRDCVERASAMASFLQGLAVGGATLQFVVVTRSPIASPIAVTEIEKRLAWPVAGAIPPAPDAFARAAGLGRPILQTDPDGTVSQGIRQLAAILH